MYLVIIAWMYVAVMMAVAEATHSNGTVLGAVFTFVLYGLLPAGIVAYIMGTPLRRKARRAREAQETQAAQEAAQALGIDPTPAAATPSVSSLAPDAGAHAPTAAQTGTVASVRKPD